MPPATRPSPGRRGDTTVAAVARLDPHLNQMWDDCTIDRTNVG